MGKVSFTLGEFRRFAQELPADMAALSALKAFLVARGAINTPGRISSAVLSFPDGKKIVMRGASVSKKVRKS